jgi:hypothetical protein
MRFPPCIYRSMVVWKRQYVWVKPNIEYICWLIYASNTNVFSRLSQICQNGLSVWTKKSKRITFLPYVFAHSRPTWGNSRWKIHPSELTHVENTPAWVNSRSGTLTGMNKHIWEKSNNQSPIHIWTLKTLPSSTLCETSPPYNFLKKNKF